MVRDADRVQAGTWKAGGCGKDRGGTDSVWKGTEKRDPVQYVLVLGSWLSTRCNYSLLSLHSRALTCGGEGNSDLSL